MAGITFPEMNLYARHRLSGGRSVTAPCRLFLLGKADIPEALRMYESVVHGLDPDIFARAAPEELEAVILGEGLMAGVRFGKRIICLRSLITDKDKVRENAEKWKLDYTQCDNSAMTGFCVVDRDFRGNNVQFLSYYYIENLAVNHFNSIITTVAPRNIFSLQNVFNNGFTIIGINRIYSNTLRYIMKKHFVPGSSIWTRHHLQIPLSDIKAQQEALGAGLTGYKLIRSGRGFRLLFGKITAAEE